MRILADASLPGLENAFPKPFILSRYSDLNELSSLLVGQDILFCRSTLKVNSDLLKDHPIQYVATASSGIDHLDQFFLKSQQIQIIDAKGSNASSVADYVMASLAYLDQQHLVNGKKAGIIGMGEVGTRVYERLKAADFQIIKYDPLRINPEITSPPEGEVISGSLLKAPIERPFQSCELENLYQVDLLCIHAQLHNDPPYPSVNLIDEQFLAQLKPGCVIINASRGGIVNEEALLAAHHHLIYCTDVYLNEPNIDKRIVDRTTLCTPHIAGHSIEAKWAAVTMVSEKLHHLLKLPVPLFATTTKTQIKSLQKEKSWQELVLSIYNPADETLYLKEAQDKKFAFLELRKNHQKRHDFSVYSDSISNKNTRLLFGI